MLESHSRARRTPRLVMLCIIVCSLMSGAEAYTATRACPSTGRLWEEVRWLRGRKEHFLASSLVLREWYGATEPPQRYTAAACLTELYIEAGKWERAFAVWQDLGGSLPASVLPRWRLGLSILALRQPRAPATTPSVYFGSDHEQQWLRALALARQHRWEEAALHFAQVHQACTEGTPLISESQPACRASRSALVALSKAPAHRSPALAVAMSALLPGAGLLYADHKFDALAYGPPTLLLGWLTWNTHDRSAGWMDQRAGTYVLAGITAALYGAGLVAAHDNAQRLNEVRDWQHELAVTSGNWPELPSLSEDATAVGR